MKKVFKLRNLDCANCAAKMESSIQKLNGVTKATVSFMTQRLTLEAQDERFEQLIDEAQTLIRKIEPDCEIIR